MIKGYFYADENMPITQMVFDNAACYDEWHKTYEKDLLMVDCHDFITKDQQSVGHQACFVYKKYPLWFKCVYYEPNPQAPSPTPSTPASDGGSPT